MIGPDRRGTPRPLSPLVALALPLTLAACSGGEGGGGGGGATTGADGFPRDTLVIAEGSDANNLISAVSQSASDGAIIDNIFYSLVESDFDCELSYKPAMAESWEWNEDGTVLTMKLRQGVTWQDGEPVTAEDFAFTMGLVEDPAVASPRLAYIQDMEEGARPKVIDDYTLEWHFDHPYDRTTQVAHTASVAPVPQHVLEGAERTTLRGHPFNVDPVVNGRWKVSKWERGQRIILEPNENWSGPTDQSPKLKRVIFRILPEYATRLVELETGGIDLMQAIQVADADRLAKEHPEIKLYRRGWRSMDYIGWNAIDPEDYKAKRTAADEAYNQRAAEIDAMSVSDDEKAALKKKAREETQVRIEDVAPHPLFGDPKVRVALTKAINRDKIINDLLKSQVTGEVYGRPSVSTITPALCKVHNDDIQPLPYDIEVAKAELAALGWTDTDGDGILDKNGQPFRFTLQTNSENPRRAKAAIIVQANLKDIGVDAQIEKIEFNTFAEKHRKKDFHATLGGWSAGLFVDPSVIWGEPEANEFNFVSYNDDEVQALIEKGLSEPDPEKSAPIWKEMQAKIYEDQPYTFLYWQDEIVGLHERFEDAKINVSSPYQDLHTWWVPAEKVKYKR